MDQLEEVEDIKENDLDLLMKHLNRLGKIASGVRSGYGPVWRDAGDGRNYDGV